MSRETTNKILELVEEGVFDAQFALNACLQWMGEYEVQSMVDNQVDWDDLGLGSDDEEE